MNFNQTVLDLREIGAQAKNANNRTPESAPTRYQTDLALAAQIHEVLDRFYKCSPPPLAHNSAVNRELERILAHRSGIEDALKHYVEPVHY